uniref:metaxin-2-like n=1 Tax=Ciona intestinalis TaxID=7719 RepID=UPI0002B8D81D
MSLLHEIIMSQIEAPENWPDNVTLYKPIEESQILLNENAASLTVQVFMHMTELRVKVIQKHNAEFMSPSTGLPVLFCGNLVLSEPSPIINFLKKKANNLSSHLNDVEITELKAYIELVKNVLVPAELFITWAHEDTIKKITYKRYGSPYKWPLKHI